jgi:hypothetical protein
VNNLHIFAIEKKAQRKKNVQSEIHYVIHVLRVLNFPMPQVHLAFTVIKANSEMSQVFLEIQALLRIREITPICQSYVTLYLIIYII